MPGGSLATISSSAAMASPELLPGEGSPWMAMAGMPLKRSSLGGPKVQRLVAMAEKGTISPARLRTYQRPRSSGLMRNGASACR